MHSVHVQKQSHLTTITQAIMQQNDMPPADGSSTAAYRLSSHLANASVVAPASLPSHPLLVAVWPQRPVGLTSSIGFPISVL